MTDTARRSPPALLTAALLVLTLAALVAIAARGTPVWTLVRPGPVNRYAIAFEILALCGIGLIAAAIITTIAHRMFVARRPDAPRLRSTLLRALPITAMVLTVASLMVIERRDLAEGPDRSRPFRDFDLKGGPGSLWGINDNRDSPVRAGDGEREEETGEIDPDPYGGFEHLFVVLGGVLLLVAGAAAWRTRSSRTARADPGFDDAAVPDPDQGVVHDAVVGTIDAMLADPDPNTAVIGAYARLLEGLEESGSGRRRHEAPMEHLHRALSMLRVRPEPLHRLIALFELARFSTRPLDMTHREDALAALREVAVDLGTPTGEPPTGAGRP